MTCRTLADYDLQTIQKAYALITSDTLYRSEAVKGPAKWLLELASSVLHKRGRLRNNLIWLAVANAPEGFLHIRSGVLGTLLDDVKNNVDAETAAEKFRSKLHPLQYQRPTAAPREGQIAAAEKLVAELGVAPAFARRFANPTDIPAAMKLWEPTAAPVANKEASGIFSHLKENKSAPFITAPSAITWDKFNRTVLPTAKKIYARSTAYSLPFVVFTTAVDYSAPPILQWDTEAFRNPIAWYCWYGGRSADYFGLENGAVYEITQVIAFPSNLSESYTRDKRVAFIVKGANETRNGGAGLFPEFLKSELHGIRAVVEAHSNKSSLSGLMEKDHVVGLAVPSVTSIIIRVFTADNIATEYIIDRWD